MENLLYRAAVLLLACISLASSLTSKHSCSMMRTLYREKGLREGNVPISAIQGSSQRTCGRGYTCCTEDMETTLTDTGSKEFEDLVYKSTSYARNTFKSRAKKFDDFFKKLLHNSQKDLHEMFLRTYGALYVENASIFTDLFAVLTSYYEGADIDLLAAMDQFFSKLFLKMFQLLHSSKHIGQEYMACIGESMDELQPFGTVPQKLSIQVRRSFIAGRTFVQALAVGADVSEKVSKVLTSGSCDQALMRMNYCQACKGEPDLKPCYKLCTNVMKGCLAHLAQLDTEWNRYLELLKQVAERLEGPFNLEAVVDPIDIKISDAIMNLQEHSEEINQKVAKGCGTLPSIQKRDSPLDPFGSDRYRPKENQPRPTTAAGTSLDRLVRDIRSRIDIMDNFWGNLAYSICNDESLVAAVSNEGNCWNGEAKGSYDGELVGTGLQEQVSNPEVNVDTTRTNILIMTQAERLKDVSRKLKSAYNGVDVDYIDNAEDTEDGDYSSGSGDDSDGSGNGSGSGDGGDGGPNGLTSDPVPTDDDLYIYRPTRKPSSSSASTLTWSTLSLLSLTLLAALPWW